MQKTGLILVFNHDISRARRFCILSILFFLPDLKLYYTLGNNE
jgi:hypothetical protein